jgi:capsular polysaccharide biosynthesis protein
VSQFDNISFLKVLYKWRLHLIAVVVAAALLGALLSSEWFIQPKYKSTAILYPANLTPYGNETATEQMLQLMQSADIRKAVCDRFNLADRYSIDLNKKGAFANLYDNYNENVDIRRTEFESVRIDVYDTDPKEACNIVDTIINLMNLKARSLQRSKTAEVVRLLGDQLQYKRLQIDSLEGALRILREKYGLLDYYIQSKEALKIYYKIIANGGSKEKLKDLDGIMRNLEDKGAESVSLKQLHQKAFETYAEIRVLYDKALSDSRKELTYANVVAKPYPADKKSSPIRWVIMCVSALSAFVFSLLTIIVVENKEKIFSKFK